MKAKLLILLFLCSTLLFSCKSEEDKLNHFINTDNFFIEVVFHGGIAGKGGYTYHYKEVDSKRLLIAKEKTDFQNYILLDLKKRKLLKTFLKRSFETHDPNKDLTASCIGGLKYEYTLKDGNTTLALKPNRNVDSIFWEITKELKY